MAERKNPQLDAEHQAILRKMMLLPENRTCADCKGPSPRWASTNLGIFICITCSGIHRKLGTHISQVRSITLDTWTPSQIQHFKKFGNAKASHYFEACLPPDFRRPNSADSMPMERFIRDKYENKRYITIENGGLGGQSVSRNRPSRLAQRPSPGALGPRPAQSVPASHQPAYDSTPTVRKTGMSSMSYGGRFSRPIKPTREPRKTTATAKSFASRTNTINPLQRANTLKQLLAMGFPQDVAVKAVGAGDGDLQRSLDWVLQQDGQSMNQAPSTAPPRPIQKDLLDFGDPSPPTAASQTTQQRPVPKILATESLISSTAKDTSEVPKTVPTTNNGFADFANFGDFQQALPSEVPSKQHSTSSNLSTSTTPKSATLTSSLANLYKKSPPNPTTIPSHIPPSSKAASPPLFPNSLHTVGKASIGSTHANEDSLGLTTFGSLSPQNLRLRGKTVPSMRLSEAKQHAGVQVPQTLPSKTEPPPPPPPPEHLMFPSTLDNQPPPPSPKVESSMNQTSSLQNHGKTHEGEQSTSSSNVEAKEEPPKDDSNEKEEQEKKEEEEEEDPFAALSMMALSRATSAQKKRKDKKSSSLPKELEPSSSKGVEVVESSINLDELLS